MCAVTSKTLVWGFTLSAVGCAFPAECAKAYQHLSLPTHIRVYDAFWMTASASTNHRKVGLKNHKESACGRKVGHSYPIGGSSVSLSNLLAAGQSGSGILGCNNVGGTVNVLTIESVELDAAISSAKVPIGVAAVHHPKRVDLWVHAG